MSQRDSPSEACTCPAELHPFSNLLPLGPNWSFPALGFILTPACPTQEHSKACVGHEQCSQAGLCLFQFGFSLCFETGSQVLTGWPQTHSVDKGDSEVLILMCPAPECWGYACTHRTWFTWCWELNPDFTSAGTHPLSRTKACLVLKTGLTRTPSNPPSSTTQVAGIRCEAPHIRPDKSL